MKYKYDEWVEICGQKKRIRANSLKEFKDKIKKHEDKINSGSFENLSLESWLEKYISIYRSKSYTQQKELLSQCKILDSIADRKLTNIKSVELQEILNKFALGEINLGNTPGPKANNTIRKYYQLICSAFKSAYIHGLIPKDVSEPLILPKGKKAVPRRALTDSEVVLVEKAIKTHPQGLFMAISLYCGLRPNEIKVLQWKDIDLKNNYIIINKALKKDGVIGEPKSEAGNRTVPIPKKLIDLLHPKGPFALVCPNQAGNMHTRNSYERMWNSFKREMHIWGGGNLYRNKIQAPHIVADDLVLYCLRHTYCTNLQAAGVPINVARELMGHADISTTAEIYTHSSKVALEDARNKIDDFVQVLSKH